MVRISPPVLSIVGWGFVGLVSAYLALLLAVLFWLTFAP
jgi:hypothetical protein